MSVHSTTSLDASTYTSVPLPYMREAQFLVEEGATPQAVDKALYDFGMAMGIFAVDDMGGIDVGWRVRQERKHLEKPGLRQPLMTDKLYQMGRLGQKSGAGWYLYDGYAPWRITLSHLSRRRNTGRQTAFARVDCAGSGSPKLVGRGDGLLDWRLSRCCLKHRSRRSMPRACTTKAIS
jgi:3-hydroxyacyl-CoA dehydrogenase